MFKHINKPVSKLIHQSRYGIVGVSDKQRLDEWEGFVQRCMEYSGGYSMFNQSCQEYVIYMMYDLCYPPLFNVSDTKGLLPLLVVIFPFFWHALGRWIRDMCVAIVADIFT